MRPIEAEVARGMRFMHLLALALQRQDDETARLVDELITQLIARGIISGTEWAEALQKQNLREVPL